jgi:hypothetical protein
MRGLIDVPGCAPVGTPGITCANSGPAAIARSESHVMLSRTAHAGPIDDDTLVYRIEFHAVDEG